MFPVEGIQYSEVCGRIIGYQKGQPGAFLLDNLNQPQTIDSSYVDGISLTYGSPHQHIWTFANALDEYSHGVFYNQKCPCSNITEQHPINIPSTTTFVKLVFHQIRHIVILHFMLTIHCGMVMVVVQPAQCHAAHSTIHHGFANNYLSQLVLIWK